MKRREFSLSAASVAATLSLPVLAQQPSFEEGKNYTKLNTPAATEAPQGQVEVLEFFWYSCAHCNSFEPLIEQWLKTTPDYLHLRRIPVAFNASFVPQQKLYYALEGMGKLQELHTKVFRAIHVERQRLNKDNLIFAWIDRQNEIDLSVFKEMYNSFGVANQVRKATQLQDTFKVEGVPSMGVAGRYYIDGGMAGSMENVLRVVEYLADKERKA